MSVCPNCLYKIRRKNSKKIGQTRVHKRCPDSAFEKPSRKDHV